MVSHDDFTPEAPNGPDQVFFRDDDDAGTDLTDGLGVCTFTQMAQTIADELGFSGKHNITATAAPTGTNDSSENYEPGSIWVDTVADEVYICADNTSTLAVWKQIGTGSYTLTESDIAAIYEAETPGTPASLDEIILLENADQTNMLTATITQLGAKLITDGGLLQDSDFTAASPGLLTKQSAGVYTVTKTNMNAVSDPGASHDSNAGYSVGSLWVNVSADSVWMCVDSTVSAAIWAELNAAPGAGDMLAANNLSDVANVATARANLAIEDHDLARIAGSTYSTIQHLQDVFHSTGVTSGGGITDDADGTISVAAGTGLIRATDSQVAEILFMDWGAEAGANVALTDNDMNYVYVEYNAGSPQVIATITERTDLNTNVFLGSVYRSGTTLHITEDTRALVGDHALMMIERMKATMPFARESGATLGETGTRNISVAAGVFWEGLTQFSTSAFDSSVADTFSYHYDNGAGGWTTVASSTQIDNTQYDNGTGTLATLTNNKYGVHWVYLSTDSDVHVLYGTGDYTLASAESAGAPASVPPFFDESHVRLLGKIIIQKSASTFTEILSAFANGITGATATEHGDLLGLAADDHTQYLLVDGTRLMSGALNMGSNNITNPGDVDGRDLSVDGAKLDGIEALATADQTGAEIKTAYEAEANTNAFTDADHSKLDGIAAGAIANVVEDLTPQLGGALDVNGKEITGAIDLHSTGDIICELGDAAGANELSIVDSAGTQQAKIDSDGVFKSRARIYHANFQTGTTSNFAFVCLWVAPHALTITKIEFVSPNKAMSVDAVNYWDIDALKNGVAADNLTTSPLSTSTTAITAGVPVDMGTIVSDGAEDLVANDVILMDFTKTVSPATWSSRDCFIRITCNEL